MKTIRDFVGETLNGYTILSRVDNNKVSTKCTKCNRVATKPFSRIKEKAIRCYGCEPSTKDLYLNDIRDLMKLGMSASEIQKQLGCNYNVMAVLMTLIRKETGGSAEDTYEYSFYEIAEALGISYAQARAAYDSGLKKLKCNVAFMGYVEDVDYTILPPEHAQTA